jgi:hypothetical protein
MGVPGNEVCVLIYLLYLLGCVSDEVHWVKLFWLLVNIIMDLML